LQNIKEALCNKKVTPPFSVAAGKGTGEHVVTNMPEDISILQVLNDFYELGLNPLSTAKQLSIKSPFRDDQHPSFSIYLDTNTAYDWGTGESFNNITLIERALGISRLEALQTLNEKYGLSPLSAEQEALIHRLHLLQKYVAVTSKCLGPEHIEALKERGISEQTIQSKQCGFHPPGLDDLEVSELIELGITDDFVGRIILPGHLNGRLVYVVGWDPACKDGKKYVFAANWPRPIVGTIGENPLLVEGIFDLWVFESAQIPAICTLSSNVSKKQNQFLKRLSNFFVAFDGDEAGKTAANDLAKEHFPRTKAVILPDGEDPNSLYCALGQEKFKSKIEELKNNAIDPLKEALKNLDSAVDQFSAIELLKGTTFLVARLAKAERNPYVDIIHEKVKRFSISKGSIREMIKAAFFDLREEDKKENNSKDGDTDIPDVKEISEWILNEHIFVTDKISKTIFHYREAEGTYGRDGDHIVHEMVKQRLGEHYTIVRYNNVKSYIQAETYGDVAEPPDYLICIKDGILNIDTYELIAHRPDYFFVSQLPLKYNPQARCPNIEKFISEVVSAADVPQIYELIGYCLWRNYPIAVSVCFLGDGSNGKSTLLELLTTFLGKENISTREIDVLSSNRFAVADLYGKYANIAADLPDKPLQYTGTFKMLTGGDMLTAEFKFKQGFPFRNYAKLIFSANKLPETNDDTDAFFRRWLLPVFPNTFSGKNAKSKAALLAELTTDEELSGLLNKALEGLKRLKEKGMFSNAPTVEELRAIYTAKSSPVRAFVNDCVDILPDGFVGKQALYEHFCEYCRGKNYPIVSEQTFKEKVPQVVSVVSERPSVGGTRIHGWRGITLRDKQSHSDNYELNGSVIMSTEDEENRNTPAETEAQLEDTHYVQPVQHFSNLRYCTETKNENKNSNYILLNREQAGQAGHVGHSDEGDISASNMPVVAVDIETTGLDPFKDDIKLVSYVGNGLKEAYESPEPLKEVLADQTILKVFHNAAFDVYFLNVKGYIVNNYACTMVMAQVLDNNAGSHKLVDLAKAYLNIELDKSLQHGKNWKGFITDDHKEYALKDADVTYQLYEILNQEITAQGLTEVLEREKDALPAIIRLQLDGFSFDTDSYRSDLTNYQQQKDALEQEIKEELMTDINLASPKQLLDCLRTRGLTDLRDTNDETLAACEDVLPELQPTIKKLRQWRELHKLTTSYGEQLLEKVNGDGRIHASFRLIGAVTGRMSCNEPNLQQVPPEVREYFKAPAGKKLVIADFSQLELRIAAQLSSDATMLKVLQEGGDLHTKTAQLLLHKSAVTKEDRRLAKGVNFGLTYGMSSWGLQRTLKASYGITITENDAEQFRNNFLASYSGIRRWHEQQVSYAQVRTLGGRIWDNLPAAGKRGWRNRLNYPVQGSGAEGLKESLILLIKELPMKWKLVNVIHDEIVLEVPEEDVTEASELLKMCMVEGMKRLVRNVPIEVEVSANERWIK
jgi:P4 family phage/plasmid primase-like protien